MTAKLKTAVLGATGYSGLELTRILLRHPRVEKPVLLRRSSDRSSDNGVSDLAEIFPALSGNGGYPLQPLSWPALKQKGIELLFLATPHEASRALVPEAIARGLRVVDLSGAWRLKQDQHRAVYGFKDASAETAAELTERAVYGRPLWLRIQAATRLRSSSRWRRCSRLALWIAIAASSPTRSPVFPGLARN